MAKPRSAVAVITADLVGSTRYQPRDRALITRRLRQAFVLVAKQYPQAVNTPATFRITAGDEFQWVVAAVPDAFDIVVFLRAVVAAIDVDPVVAFRASIGVGVLTVGGGASSYEQDGPAFVRSRAGLTFLGRRRSRWTALVSGEAATDRTADAVLTLLDSFQQRWTRSQWEAVRWALAGLNRTEIAARLGVAHQSASKRLIAAEWDTFAVGCGLIRELLESGRGPTRR